ncbi:tripartite tricarboxylate transporter substrate binding protein [Hydrogenophaga sp. 2FB]|uniref:tripartite tricarboxylate transporter substrate binding protein n=1 Tax=Hydrogenophaga sp. 2FB TaxID=2502187 RepID=UPI0010F508EE|nr:tripartite tricarboxylate transporter substrate binding protein [Hydrogenophaga sp. 2FB]
MKITESRKIGKIAKSMTYTAHHVSSLFVLALCMTLSTSSSAQEYPAKPIKVIVPFSAGGSVDLVARVISHKMSSAMGQQLVIENRPGAAGNIGATLVAKAPADGYTLLVTSNAYAVNPELYEKMPFEAKDLFPVGMMAAAPNILVVRPSFPAKTLPEIIALAKMQPVMYASAGTGTTTHLAAELLASVAGISLTQVNYKGGSGAINDLLAGQVDLMFSGILTAMPFLKGDQLRPVAVTSLVRSKAVPDVPTVAELGYPGYETMNWYVLMAPTGTPVPIIEKLNRQLNLALKDVDVSALLKREGAEPMPGASAEAQSFISKEARKWRKTLEATGIRRSIR